MVFKPRPEELDPSFPGCLQELGDVHGGVDPGADHHEVRGGDPGALHAEADEPLLARAPDAEPAVGVRGGGEQRLVPGSEREDPRETGVNELRERRLVSARRPAVARDRGQPAVDALTRRLSQLAGLDADPGQGLALEVDDASVDGPRRRQLQASRPRRERIQAIPGRSVVVGAGDDPSARREVGVVVADHEHEGAVRAGPPVDRQRCLVGDEELGVPNRRTVRVDHHTLDAVVACRAFRWGSVDEADSRTEGGHSHQGEGEPPAAAPRCPS